MAKEQRKSVVLYVDKLKMLLSDGAYSNELIVNVLKSIIAYQDGETENYTTDKMAEMVFKLAFKADIDRNNEKWQRTKERRAVAGQKGGLAKAANRKATDSKRSKPTKNVANVANATFATPELELQQPTETKTVALPSENDNINFDQLKIYWNDQIVKNRSNMPKVNDFSEKRMNHVKARLKKHGKHAILTAINNAMTSDFFNNNSFACFDWIFSSDNNFCKTLDGNYNRKTTQQSRTTMSAMGQMITDFNDVNNEYTDTIISGQNEDTVGVPYAIGVGEHY